MTTLYLIRHGETVNNASGCYNGMRDDHPLNEVGQEQVVRLSAAFEAIALDAVYTSTLLRAKQTGEILRGQRQIPLLTREGLVEFDFGLLSGMQYKQATQQYPEIVQGLRETPESTCCPGGESGRTAMCRGMKALSEIVNENRGSCVAVVAHGMLLQLLFAELAGMPLQRRRELSIFNTGYAKLEIEDNGDFTICYFNRYNHLSAEDLEKLMRKYKIYPEAVATLIGKHHYASFCK